MNEPNRLLWDANFDCNDRGSLKTETPHQAYFREQNHIKYLRLIKLAEYEAKRARTKANLDRHDNIIMRRGGMVSAQSRIRSTL